MCARPPLIDLVGTAGEPETEHRDRSTGMGESDGFYLPLARAHTLDSDNMSLRQVPLARAQLRSVKSGPAQVRPTAITLCSSSDEAASSSHTSEVPSLRERSCSPSGGSSAGCGSASRSCAGSCGGPPQTDAKSKGCSKGEACCGGGSCGSSSSPGNATSGEPSDHPRIQAASADLESLAAQPSSRPRPGVARVTVRKGLAGKKRPAVAAAAAGDGDASKPTFGDLEDLWRKDSEARNYCAFVCSAPAMCRDGHDGLVDPLSVGEPRRKRMKTSQESPYAEQSAALALLA